jgi:8-oxo-dGTP diphosphatase
MGPTEPDRLPIDGRPAGPPAGGEDGGCLAAGRGLSGAPIDTAHLTLRRLVPQDAPEVARLLDEWEMARHTASIPHPYTPADAERFVARVEADTRAGHAVVFAIEERLERRLVGCVGAALAPRTAEVGYWIARRAWNRGYASEAMRRLVRLLFDNFALDYLWASVSPENPASRRVLDKAGFIFERREETPLPARGTAAPLDYLRLDRQAWLAARAARQMLLVAAAAIIDVDGRVLLAQRPPGKSMAGQWEFPGGKVHPGETPEAALVRELEEELGIGVSESCLAPLAFASHDYDDFHLLMPLYACRQWRGQPAAREGQRLAWVAAPRLADYPMPPADVPLVALLRDWL